MIQRLVIHRDTISKRLANLPFESGKKGAKLYSSDDALVEIYKTDSLEAARAEQARTAAQLNAIRAEDLRKTRIPIGVVRDVMNEVFQIARFDHNLMLYFLKSLRSLWDVGTIDRNPVPTLVYFLAALLLVRADELKSRVSPYCVL